MLSFITPEQYTPGTIANIPTQKRKKGNPGTRTKTRYKDVIITFDIETTRLQEYEQAIMYVWMLHIHGHCTIVGRTWEQLRKLKIAMCSELAQNECLVVFVHNLSYEFQFLRAIWDFAPEDVFALKPRKVAKASANFGRIEYRCSYIHSNMSLAAYTMKMKVEHRKQSGGDFDYTIRRFPWTELTQDEYKYCIHDVVGLAEAIETEMKMEGDTLYSFPLTSTGYVRRNAKRAMRNAPRYLVSDMLPDLEIYTLCREAFRGGNTHANRYYATGEEDGGKPHILRNVKSADRSSSYPDVICNCKFPVTEFRKVGKVSFDDMMWLLNHDKAVIMRVAVYNIRLVNKYWGCPYLTTDKSRNYDRAKMRADNGRVLDCDYLETTLTDVDLRIVLQEYDYDNIIFYDCAYSDYGYLPKPFIDETIQYYKGKTELKGLGYDSATGTDYELLYNKYKNLVNALYGLLAQDPVKQENIYDPTYKDEKGNPQAWHITDNPAGELLEQYNRRAFLSYQWACWVTAWARYRLEEGIRLASSKILGTGNATFIYCDTDSVKYLGDIDWDEYNKQRIADSTKSGAFATDRKGKTHYMGVYEPEATYREFATMGAKKYVYNFDFEPCHRTHITIAGVSKKKGGLEMDKHGGLKCFRPGFTFHDAGGTESVYNDFPQIGEIEIDNHKLRITPNIVIRDSEYTLGITAEYREILRAGCADPQFDEFGD